MIKESKVTRVIKFLLAGFSLGLISSQFFGLTHYRTFPTPINDLISSVRATKYIVKTDHAKGASSFADSITSISISPDGNLMASASPNGVIKLWNFKTRKVLRSLLGHIEGVNLISVTFTPDSKHLVSGGADGTVRIWDLQRGESIRTFRASRDSIRSVSVSPDNRRIASSGGSEDESVVIWDFLTGSEICKLTSKSPFGVDAIAIRSDGKYLAGSNSSGALKIWDLSVCKELKTLENIEGSTSVLSLDYYSFVQYSPDATMIANNADRNIRIWNSESGKSITDLIGHRDHVSSVAFTSSGKMLASGSRDGTVKIWNLETGRVIQTFLGSRGPVYSVAISPDGTTIVSSGKDGMIRFWDGNLD
jgi:WD40 repeat protein